ncbi:MAG: class I tRNA ligase family protein [Deltaproteobacteria bacterium]|nr:class I tRNA ligase family protein [Deltaproteobacteria bacterium]
MSEEVSRALEEYRFNDAAGLCYQFVWHEFCDWYLEMAKQGLYGGGEMERKSTRGMFRYRGIMAALAWQHGKYHGGRVPRAVGP